MWLRTVIIITTTTTTSTTAMMMTGEFHSLTASICWWWQKSTQKKQQQQQQQQQKNKQTNKQTPAQKHFPNYHTHKERVVVAKPVDDDAAPHPAVQFHFSFSSKWHRSVRKGPYALRSVSQQSRQGWQYLSCWTQIVLDLGGWNVGRFCSPLLFPSGGQCCDALACPCSESSSSLWAPLPCQAADQMWYLLCLPVYLPVHSHWLRRAQDSRSTEVFVAEDCVWLCASRGSQFQTPPQGGVVASRLFAVLAVYSGLQSVVPNEPFPQSRALVKSTDRSCSGLFVSNRRSTRSSKLMGLKWYCCL